MLETIVHTLSPARRPPTKPHLGLSPVEYVRKESASHSLLFPDSHSHSLVAGWSKESSQNDDSNSAQLLPGRHVRIVISRWSCDSPIVLFDSNSASPEPHIDPRVEHIGGRKGTSPPTSFPPTSIREKKNKRPCTIQDAIMANDAELELMLACMFGSTVTTYKGVTEKMNVIPLDFNIETSRTTRLVRPGDGFGGSYARAKMMQDHQNRRDSISSRDSGSSTPHSTPTKKKSDRRQTIILTRSFSSLFSNFPATKPCQQQMNKQTGGHSSIPHETSLPQSCDTVRWSPRFSISVSINLPVSSECQSIPSPRPRRSSGLEQTSPVLNKHKNIQVPWISPLAPQNNDGYEPQENKGVALISQNWTTLSRVLCWLQQISEPRLVAIMRCYGGTANNSMIMPRILEDDVGFCQLILDAQMRIVRGLSIPRVLCGQANWKACREEINYFGHYLGGRDRSQFLSRLVTGFLAHHTDWLPRYVSRDYQQYYLEHVEAGAKSEILIPCRTVVLYQDPILARAVILLLSHFLPTSQNRRQRAKTTRRHSCTADCIKDKADLKPANIIPSQSSSQPITIINQPISVDFPSTAPNSHRTPSTILSSDTHNLARTVLSDGSTAPYHYPPHDTNPVNRNVLRSSAAKPMSFPVSASPGQTWHAGSHFKPNGRRYSGLASRNLVHTLQKARSSAADPQIAPISPWGTWKALWASKEKESRPSYEGTLSSPDETFRKSPYIHQGQTNWHCSAHPITIPQSGLSPDHIHSKKMGQVNDIGVSSSYIQSEISSSPTKLGTIPDNVLQASASELASDSSHLTESIRMSLAHNLSIQVDIPFFNVRPQPPHSSSAPLSGTKHSSVAQPFVSDYIDADRDPLYTLLNRTPSTSNTHLANTGSDQDITPRRIGSPSNTHGSPHTSPNLIENTEAVTLINNSQPYNDVCYSPPPQAIQDNVAGILSSFHPDFALQALSHSPNLESEIRGAMKLEKTPMHHFIQLLVGKEKNGLIGPHLENWVDVCSTLIVDLPTLSIKRLRLRRLIRLPSWLDEFAAKSGLKRGPSKYPGHELNGKAADVRNLQIPEVRPHFPHYQESQSGDIPVDSGANRPSSANLEELVFALTRDTVVVAENIVNEVISDSDPLVAEMLDKILGLSSGRGINPQPHNIYALSSDLSMSSRDRKCSTGGICTPVQSQGSQLSKLKRPEFTRTQSHPVPVISNPSRPDIKPTATDPSGSIGKDTFWFSFPTITKMNRNDQDQQSQQELSNSECEAVVSHSLASITHSSAADMNEAIIQGRRGSLGGQQHKGAQSQPVVVSRGTSPTVSANYDQDYRHQSYGHPTGLATSLSTSVASSSSVNSDATIKTNTSAGLESSSGFKSWQRAFISSAQPSSWLKSSPVSVMRDLIRGGSTSSMGSVGIASSNLEVYNNVLRFQVREWFSLVSIAR